jgi:hypothetical protein
MISLHTRLMIVSILLCLLGQGGGRAASVIIDGAFDDWEEIDAIYANPTLPPGTMTGLAGVSYIKTYQEGAYIYFCYAALSDSAGNGIIAFDLNQDSDPRSTYATMSAEAAWELGVGEVIGPEVLATPPTAARRVPDSSQPGYELFEWCFYRDQQLTDGTTVFGNPGDEVWFAVGTQGNALASSQLTTFTLDLIPVPEASSGLLLGLSALIGFRRRRV